jgi:hypothetical protein
MPGEPTAASRAQRATRARTRWAAAKPPAAMKTSPPVAPAPTPAAPQSKPSSGAAVTITGAGVGFETGAR